MPDPDNTAAQLEALRREFESLSSQLQATMRENTQLRNEMQVQKTQGEPVQESKIDDPGNQVYKVSPKLPPFWQQRPEIWFAHVETQFRIAGITSDQTKFDHVISQLDFKIMADIEDIVTSPPTTGKYEHLKKELTRRLSRSEEERVRQLLTEEELGDRKPSQFLRHLRSLAGVTLKDSDDSILRQLFMRRLPQHLQAILAASADPLDDIAARADKILEVAPGIAALPSFVHAAAASGGAPVVPDPYGLHAIAAQMQNLTATVAELTRERSRSHSRNRSQSKSRNQSQGSAGKLCWYHQKFKAKATKCITPCSWKSENKEASQ